MSVRVLTDTSHGERVPVLLWTSPEAGDASPETLRQLSRVASMPYVVSHVAAMADAHMASGVAVGTVFATADVVVPGALGGDLGCGMSATRLSSSQGARALDRRTLERLLSRWSETIPVGDATHRGKGCEVPDVLLDGSLSTHALERLRARLAPRHLGTLGGGNHFIELDRDPDGGLWLLVHSGSRGLGAALCAHHRHATSGTDPLAALSLQGAAGQAYLSDQEWALAFAAANRARLATLALEAFAEITGSSTACAPPIDVPHNFIRRESWNNHALYIHRKGAAPAPAGELALVPGSMGTASYLVRGLGNERSFGSCSHGAGRVMSRREARERIRPEALLAGMRRIVFPRGNVAALVEEAPGAYRDIRRVLEAQDDLVVPELRLEPLAVLKG